MRRIALAALLALLCLGEMSANAAQIRTRFLFRQPDASAPPPIPPPSDESEAPLAAELAWRSLAMRDENGLIPVGAIYLANLFRRQQLLNLIPVGGLAVGAKGTPHTLSYLSPASWSTRGPQNVGGRTRSLLIDSNNPNTMYAGAVSGGVWKTTNGCSTWTPLTDFMSNIAIMTMVFDPTVSNHSVIYAGTGDPLAH